MSKNICLLNLQGCIKYNESGSCVQCEESKYLTSLNTCQDKLPGCVYNNGICSSCLNPFIFNNNICVMRGC